MKKILAFDVGTTAIKTCLFSQELKLLSIRTDEYSLCTDNHYVEMDANIYWETMCRAVSYIARDSLLDEVSAICLTTQGETLIPIDEFGNPLSKAVVWLDDRAKEEAEYIQKVVSQEELYQYTGVTDMNGFVPLAKLLWFRCKHPKIYGKTYKFLLLEDYLLYRMTGRIVTEKSLLTSTAYYDIRNDRYWIEMLNKLQIDVKKLPQVLECGQFVENLNTNAAEVLGLSCDVAVFAGAMDQIAAAIGGGGLQSGVVTATVGTAMVLTSEIASMDECKTSSLIVYRGFRENQYVILPLCNTAGAVFKWYKDQCSQHIAAEAEVRGLDVYDLLCEEAADVPPGADGVIMLPYFAGSVQPKSIPDVKGVIFGLDLGSNRKRLTRALLESIGYMLRENLDMLREIGSPVSRIHFFGGGAKNLGWCQIIADITGVELVLLEQSECGALGAAMLGAVSMGWYPNILTAQRCNNPKIVVTPNLCNKEVYDITYSRYKKLFELLLAMYK